MVIDLSSFYYPREFDRLLEEFWKPFHISERRLAYPPVNLSEDDHNVYVTAELPGVAMEDVELTLTDGSLILKGKRVPEEGNYFRQERPAGSFQRIVNVNVALKRDDVKATLNNGLLEVVLPKSEDAKPRKISIDVG